MEYLIAVVVLFFTSLNVSAAGNDRVRIAKLEPTVLMVRSVNGSYAQHPQVIAALMSDMRGHRIPAGEIIGVYPQDPQAVAPRNLKWALGVERGNWKSTPRGYRLRTMPAVTAATIDSTVAGSKDDGLYLLEWIARNNYVAVGPTRMIYHDGQKTTIITPVARRPESITESPIR